MLARVGTARTIGRSCNSCERNDEQLEATMDLPAVSAGQMVAILICVAIAIVGAAILFFVRRRRTQQLRNQFGSAEYTRAMKEAGSQRKAESELNKRAERVEGLHIQPLASGDRVRFVDSWAKVQARFVDSPGAAVTDADQLLSEVMSMRGYPVSDFEQRVADISVDHPLVLDNYRAAHQVALRQTRGQASTEELRQAMIHCRTLFEDLLREPGTARAAAAS